jgi:sugar lactone lactonase YvrE
LTLSGGKLYWTDQKDNVTPHQASSIAPISTAATPAVIITGLIKPHDLAIDTDAGKLYYTDQGDGNDGPGDGGIIYRSDLDGSNPGTLLDTLGVGIRGIAIDSTNNKLYWTDHQADHIYRADLDGSNPTPIVNHRACNNLTTSPLTWQPENSTLPTVMIQCYLSLQPRR